MNTIPVSFCVVSISSGIAWVARARDPADGGGGREGKRVRMHLQLPNGVPVTQEITAAEIRKVESFRCLERSLPDFHGEAIFSKAQ